jgi:flagellar L-ring protein precursor FlgH
MTRLLRVALISLAPLLAAPAAGAADLYAPGNWPSLAADRKPTQRGDIVTIVVWESATAANTASTGSRKRNRLEGRVSAGSAFDERGGIDLDGRSDSEGTTERSGRMVAQISAVVEEVLPNGDLRVSGSQLMNINGEKTTIRIVGRVRPADISAGNAVLSSRLADAMIDYDGTGFVSRSGRPGLVTRIFNWMGLL